MLFCLSSNKWKTIHSGIQPEKMKNEERRRAITEIVSNG